MMKETYTLLETAETDQSGHSYTGYGIALCNPSGTESSSQTSVPDLFLDRQRAEAFVRLCNEEDVEPCHLLDVIQNCLA